MQEIKETKIQNQVGFIALQDLSKEDVKKFSLFNVRLKRSLNKSGLNTQATLMMDPNNLQIQLVSSQRSANGKSTQLRYFLPDVFIALILELDLAQKDETGKDRNDWIVSAAVRFVKGKYKDSDKEYHSLELIFKQFKYHVHFLTPHQLRILEILSEKKQIIDKTGKPIKLNWLTRPDAIDEIEDSEDFVF